MGCMMIILNLISSLIFKVVDLLIGLLPDFIVPVFEVPTLLVQILNLLYYILPMDTLSTLFALTIAITAFRIVLAIINKVLNLLEVL